MKQSQARVILHTTNNVGQGQRPKERQNEAGFTEIANKKISKVRKHGSYESLLTFIDSLIMWNGILTDFGIVCFAL